MTCFISGIFEKIYSVSNSKELHNWGWILAGGIIELLPRFWLMSSPLRSIILLPFFAGLTIVFYTGCAFITIGIFRIILSFKLKHIGKTIEYFVSPID
jgi:uncharacterized membrane protein HdeD (DUF308 family)